MACIVRNVVCDGQMSLGLLCWAALVMSLTRIFCDAGKGLVVCTDGPGIFLQGLAVHGRDGRLLPGNPSIPSRSWPECMLMHVCRD